MITGRRRSSTELGTSSGNVVDAGRHSINSEPSPTPRHERPAVPTAAPTSHAPLLADKAGGLLLAAGALLISAQIVMWSFDQRLNLATAQNTVFQTARLLI